MSKRRLIEVFLGGLVFGIILTLGVQSFLRVQSVVYHHPDYELGALEKTGRPLDIAIYGRGYFQFQRTDGSSGYSRLSEFTLDSHGQLVSPGGDVLQPSITIPDDFTRLHVDPEGVVSCQFSGQSADSQLGQIELSMFINADGLRHTQDGLLVETEESGPGTPTTAGQGGAGMVLQGYRLLKDVPDDTPGHLLVNAPSSDGPDDLVQEELIETGRRLDYGIEGPGFVPVQLPDGSRGFTRYLPLDRDYEGEIVRRFPQCGAAPPGMRIGRWTTQRPEGWTPPRAGGESVIETNLLGTIPPPSIPKRFFVTDVTSVESIRLYRFASPENLRYHLNGVYVESDDSGVPESADATPALSGKLKSGFLNDVPRVEP